MHAQQGLQYLSCVQVCLSVCYCYSATTRNEVTKERHQRPQCYIDIDIKKVIILKLLC